MTKGLFSGSLKGANLKWIISLATIDAFVVVAFVVPSVLADASWTRLAVARVITALVAPAVVLLLTEILSPRVKAILVYWKRERALPGHQAFTLHGPADPRVDMKALERHVGALPVEPSEQNTFWYKLYKIVENEKTVLGPHRSFLLYRDVAAMSVLLFATVPLGLLFMGATTKAVAATAGIFAIQYLATALASRHCGERLVSNVLALHANKKYRLPK